MRLSPVRFMSGLVVSTGLISTATPAFSDTEDRKDGILTTGFKRLVPFSALGLKRDDSCSEYEWVHIEKETVPMDSPVIEYLLGDAEHAQFRIRCEIPFLDWSMFTGHLEQGGLNIDKQNRQITVRSLLDNCAGYPCGPARKIFEELAKIEMTH